MRHRSLAELLWQSRPGSQGRQMQAPDHLDVQHYRFLRKCSSGKALLMRWELCSCKCSLYPLPPCAMLKVKV